MIVWVFDEYYVYSGIIFLFSAIAILFTLYETLQTREKLRKMSHYETAVNVYRKINGEKTRLTISSVDLVPGDLIEIPERVSMPCDAILLSGSCVMNEAMLTGESIPVMKNPLPKLENRYNPKEDKQYTLYAGTSCVQARQFQG